MNNNLNFAKKVKLEIASKEYTFNEKKALLSGFIRCNGVIGINKNNPSIKLKSELGPVIKLLRLSFKEIYKLDSTLSFEKKVRFGKGTIYILKIQDKQVYSILEDLEIMDSSFNRLIVNKYTSDEVFASFIRGVFLSSGSINNPSSNKTSYFLELALSSLSDLNKIKDTFDLFKEERTITFKYIKRRDKEILYLKKSDQISVFLSYIGATEAMFEFENARLMRDDLNTYNRLSICDMANFTRTIDAANKDIEMIENLLKEKPLNLFDEKTQSVIKARTKYKEANYRELVDIIKNEYSTPISKSGIAYVLNSLRNEYSKLKNDSSDE